MSTHQRNEADTRADLIDPKLVTSGWSQVDESFIRREVNITEGRIISGGMRTSPVISDYVLEYRGRRLAAVEAKKRKSQLYRRCSTSQGLRSSITEPYGICHQRS